MGGDASGPHSDVPCPSWVWEDSGSCPVVPACGDLRTCGECATHEMCAWCANGETCMTVEETFYRDCRGVIFDAPCPLSFIPGKLLSLRDVWPLSAPSFYLDLMQRTSTDYLSLPRHLKSLPHLINYPIETCTVFALYRRHFCRRESRYGKLDRQPRPRFRRGRNSGRVVRLESHPFRG